MESRQAVTLEAGCLLCGQYCGKFVGPTLLSGTFFRRATCRRCGGRNIMLTDVEGHAAEVSHEREARRALVAKGLMRECPVCRRILEETEARCNDCIPKRGRPPKHEGGANAQGSQAKEPATV